LGFKNESISTELETSTNYTTETVFSLLVNHTGDYFKKRLDEEYSVGIKMNGLETPKFDHPKFWTNPLESALPNAPDMKHITIYGVGKYTERCYFYTCQDPLTNLTSDSLFIDTLVNKPNERLENGVQDVYGDGSVPLISLGFMSANGWRHNTKQQYGKIFNPHKVQVITREYQHDPLPLVQDPRGGSKTGEHVDILGNHFLMRDILTVATGSEGSDFGDIWVSKIREISDKVDLKEVNIKY
jgi:phospholipid:diacylglycerol acyltransferase